MPNLHPSCFICIWLIFVITLQKLNFFGDLLLLLLIFISGKSNYLAIFFAWLKSLYKTKWLFIGIWISTAYYTPGDLFSEELFWLPTQQGIFAAWQYSVRLAMTMACLIWLNSWLNHQDFLLGLFGILLPFRKIFGIRSIQILVLRLTLIFQIFEDFNKNKTAYKFNELIQILTQHKNIEIYQNSTRNSEKFLEISWKKFSKSDFLWIILAIFIAIFISYL